MSFTSSFEGATADTYTTGPHVASIGQGLFFVELEHDQKFGIVGLGLPTLVGKAPYCPHGGNGFFCNFIGLCEGCLHLFGQFLERKIQRSEFNSFVCK